MIDRKQRLSGPPGFFSACRRNARSSRMADRSNFWPMVERTKPSKLRVFGESELGDCLDYFSEIQSDSALPPNESLTASERLTLIRSEMDLRHADARHRRTQRLASWAIAVGLVSIAVAVTSGVAQYFMHRSNANNWSATTGTPIFAAPTPTASPDTTPAIAATTQVAPPDQIATSTVSALTTPNPKPTAPEQRRKKRAIRSKTKTKTDSDKPIQEALRSLFEPKPTPRSNQR
jgi:hypothetical protein